MSPDAAATLAQVIPVLLLAFVIDQQLTVNPTLKGPGRTAVAVFVLILLVLPAVVEVRLLQAVMDDETLPIIWRGLSELAIVTGVSIIVIPHALELLGLAPHQRAARNAPEE